MNYIGNREGFEHGALLSFWLWCVHFLYAAFESFFPLSLHEVLMWMQMSLLLEWEEVTACEYIFVSSQSDFISV